MQKIKYLSHSLVHRRRLHGLHRTAARTRPATPRTAVASDSHPGSPPTASETAVHPHLLPPLEPDRRQLPNPWSAKATILKMQVSGTISDVLVVLPPSASLRLPEFRHLHVFTVSEAKNFLSSGFLKSCPSSCDYKHYNELYNFRARGLVARASAESNDNMVPFASLQFESPVGQLLDQISQTHPHLLPAAIDQQLENLQTARDAQKEASTSSHDSLYKFNEQGWLSLLKRCKSMEEFKQVHAQILKLGLLWDSFYGSNLVATCALTKWGSMEYACSIFRQIEEPGSFEFNTMIRGNVNSMNLEEALLLYIEMLERGIEPDNFTYPFLLKACSLLGALKEGMQIHGQVFKAGLEGDIFVQNSLISMYGKCGEIKHACAVFEQMDEKSVASWSAIIGAHASVEMWHECLKLFGDMSSEGRYRAEESTLVSVLTACTHLGSPNLGRCIHGILLRNISELNVIVKTSLIDMYDKCGCLEKGLCIFQNMAEKNRYSYTVMISGLAIHGHGREALRVFSEMLEEGFAPNDVVYVGVLSACSNAGLVNEGLQCFNRMQFEHNIKPTLQHYGCMVDLMGRAGMLREAYDLIKSIPIKPNDVVWRSLLSACKVHHNSELGDIAAKNLFMLNPNNPGDYLVLANMYARAQKWVDVARIRTEMAERDLVQTAGFSLVEAKRKVYKFVSQDKSQPQCDSIYDMIHQMEWQLKFEGYIPDTSQVLLDVDEEEKRERVKCHSQKLAIAFALIQTSEGSPIRISRNLRMCNDCHTYTKFISMIYEREITVRDRNRFHHFKDGTCSCKDYW